jgi:predicted dehydrogenase
MTTIRFGIIGCGLMGREFASAAARWKHLLGVTARPEIVAVSDVNQSVMDWFEAPFASTNYQELLARDDVDAVYVAVPHNFHAQIYGDVIRAGKHLFAEKPFGIDQAAAETILETMKGHPKVLVRCSSEFPFFPGAQRIAAMVSSGAFGKILEVRAGFCHSSDMDPTKPINWKRQVATCGEYGCMGDLGLHVVHMPIRFGFRPTNVRAFLSKIVEERPNGRGGMAPCETWDNAVLACDTSVGFPMFLETKRISPGDTNSWYLNIYGTENSAEFSTKDPKNLRTMPFTQGEPQAWRTESLGYSSAYPTVTGGIFEFGFSDAILQMWASFVEEVAGNKPAFQCARPDEVFVSHQLFTAALKSHSSSQVVEVP